MKTTGIIRRLDSLGRVVPPMEMRRALGIEDRDAIEFTLEGDAIVIRKCRTVCVFCGSTDELTEYRERPICAACRKHLAENE